MRGFSGQGTESGQHARELVPGRAPQPVGHRSWCSLYLPASVFLRPSDPVCIVVWGPASVSASLWGSSIRLPTRNPLSASWRGPQPWGSRDAPSLELWAHYPNGACVAHTAGQEMGHFSLQELMAAYGPFSPAASTLDCGREEGEGRVMWDRDVSPWQASGVLGKCSWQLGAGRLGPRSRPPCSQPQRSPQSHTQP